MQYLEPYYNALTSDQKKVAKIIVDSEAIFYLANTRTKAFGQLRIDGYGNLYLDGINLTDHVFAKYVIGNNTNITYSNVSNDTHAGNMVLAVG